MAIHSSIHAWEIPWTEEPDGLHTVHGVAKDLDHDLVINFCTFPWGSPRVTTVFFDIFEFQYLFFTVLLEL